MEKLYYRLCKGLKSKGKLYFKDDSYYNYINDYNKDWYFSIYYYNDVQKKEIEKEIEETDKDGKKYTTIQGVSGINNTFTNKICFDFDSHDNLELTRQNTLSLIDKLLNENIPKKDIQICFSGNKGFGIILDTDTFFTPEEVKNIATTLAINLETFDNKIYNPARVFRIPLTKNLISNLYKYPLTYEELKELKIEDIKELAKDNDIDVFEYQKTFNIIKLPEKIINLKNISEKKEKFKEKIDLLNRIEDIDFNTRPLFLNPSKYILHLGHFVEGERSHAAMILAATYKKAGFSKTDSYRLLKSVMERQSELHNMERFDDSELWNNVVKVVYGKNWNGGIYNGESSELLSKINLSLPYYLRDDNKNSTLVDGDYILESFKKFLDDIDKNTLKFGIKSLDKKIKLLAGTTCGIVANPGVGKSSMGMSLLAYNSQINEPSIFYSLDMSSNIVAYRGVQMLTGWDDEKIKKIYHTDNKLFMEKYNNSVNGMFKNVNYSFKYGLTPDDIRSDIISFQERTGKKLRLILVDYLENVSSSYSDPTVSSGAVSQLLANIAAELNVLIVILMQTQKSTSISDEILSMKCIKGSSVTEQSLSVALGLSRPGYSTKYTNYDTSMTVNILKNRFGNLGRDQIGWDGPSVKVRELNEQDRLNIAEIERLKQEEREEQEEIRREAWRNRNDQQWG